MVEENTTFSTETPAPDDRATRALLLSGAIAGPLYIIVALIQAFTRPGFDLTRHSVSLLSLGDLGWIQIANFVLSGLLVIAGAVGLRRTMDAGSGSVWGPRLIAVYGLSLIGAGIFVADPMSGFPPGTAQDANAVSWHGMLHFMVGGLGFLALIVACFLFARRFAAVDKPNWARYSVVTGVAFLASFIGIASGSSQPLVIAGFWLGVILAWAWLSALMASRLP